MGDDASTSGVLTPGVVARRMLRALAESVPEPTPLASGEPAPAYGLYRVDGHVTWLAEGSVFTAAPAREQEWPDGWEVLGPEVLRRRLADADAWDHKDLTQEVHDYAATGACWDPLPVANLTVEVAVEMLQAQAAQERCQDYEPHAPHDHQLSALVTYHCDGQTTDEDPTPPNPTWAPPAWWARRHA